MAIKTDKGWRQLDGIAQILEKLPPGLQGAIFIVLIVLAWQAGPHVIGYVAKLRSARSQRQDSQSEASAKVEIRKYESTDKWDERFWEDYKALQAKCERLEGTVLKQAVEIARLTKKLNGEEDSPRS